MKWPLDPLAQAGTTINKTVIIWNYHSDPVTYVYWGLWDINRLPMWNVDSLCSNDATYDLVNIGSSNGLLLDGTKLLTESKLTSH